MPKNHINLKILQNLTKTCPAVSNYLFPYGLAKDGSEDGKQPGPVEVKRNEDL